MNNQMIQKLYGGFTIGISFLFTILAFVLIVYPISGNFIKPPYNDEKFVLYQAILTILMLVAFIPQPIALVGYYLSGATGKNWFSHTLLAGLVITFLLLILTIIYVIFTYMTLEIGGFDDKRLSRKFLIPTIIFGTLNFTVFPVIFTITALVTQKVTLWKRFLPMISFVLVIVITIVLALLIYAIGLITGSQSIYYGAKDATMTQWFMLGSVAWSLVGFSLFFKNKKTENETTFT